MDVADPCPTPTKWVFRFATYPRERSYLALSQAQAEAFMRNVVFDERTWLSCDPVTMKGRV